MCSLYSSRSRWSGSASARRQVVAPGLEPFDLTVQLLRLAPELHALELVDLGLEPFDFQIALSHVLPQLRDRGARPGQQSLERIDVVGARADPACRAVYAGPAPFTWVSVFPEPSRRQ